MPRAGQTLLLPKPGHDTKHLWVVAVAANPATQEVVIVNLTTQRPHSDATVVLQPSDHEFVNHPTVVFYADARIVDGRTIDAAIEGGMFPTHRDCSPALLLRIQQGLFDSPHTPQKVKLFATYLLGR